MMYWLILIVRHVLALLAQAGQPPRAQMTTRRLPVGYGLLAPAYASGQPRGYRRMNACPQCEGGWTPLAWLIASPPPTARPRSRKHRGRNV